MTRDKKILVLQFRTDKSIKHEIQCICKAGSYKIKDLKIVNVFSKKPKIPKPSQLPKFKAMITAASGQYYITNLPAWVKKRIQNIEGLFKEAIKIGLPTISICFGHQLVACMFGGEVKRDIKQSETGTLIINLTKEGRKDPIFKDIPKSFYAILGHRESVVKTPKEACLLASSKKCKIQAYRIGNNFYGFQFHPELELEDLLWRLSLYPEYLKGKTIDDIKAKYKEVMYPKLIFKNFNNIVEDWQVKKL